MSNTDMNGTQGLAFGGVLGTRYLPTCDLFSLKHYQVSTCLYFKRRPFSSCHVLGIPLHVHRTPAHSPSLSVFTQFTCPLVRVGDSMTSTTAKDGLSPVSPASSVQSSITWFPCTHSQCEKSFNRRENLSRHLKTHQPTKSHQCSVCGKQFTRSDLCKRHEGIHKTAPAESRNNQDNEASRKRKRGSSLIQSAPDPSTMNKESNLTMNNAHFDSSYALGTGSSMDADNMWYHLANIPFNFSFDSPEISAMDGSSADWVSGEFYSALHKAENDWDKDGPPHHQLPPPILPGFADLSGTACRCWVIACQDGAEEFCWMHHDRTYGYGE
ncbi:hypothetical protein BJ878DRAFT_529127 [Calycina marina]|uniref:C2H2-type domain-containing protein n=1 Tax=Calycina marina TaxID=1763456 RepID=A0A9P8CAJ7_9HELO|nr:hypothetical protein BJ878DRAFT_529127 [Calycina marina]